MAAGAAIALTYLFGARTWGRRAGLVAALLLALMPRVFFHGHLACFDVPIMTMWLACIYAYARAVQTRSLGWVLAVGVAFGLALAWGRGVPPHWGLFKSALARAILIAAAIVWPLVAAGLGCACLVLSVRVMQQGAMAGGSDPPAVSGAT